MHKAIEPETPADRLIAHFVSNSAPLETYLHLDGPLTSRESDLLARTITGLQTFPDDLE